MMDPDRTFEVIMTFETIRIALKIAPISLLSFVSEHEYPTMVDFSSTARIFTN